MDLTGGINVVCGEIRTDQPFRVCIMDADDVRNEFWTNNPHEAAVVFELKVKRAVRRANKSS